MTDSDLDKIQSALEAFEIQYEHTSRPYLGKREFGEEETRTLTEKGWDAWLGDHVTLNEWHEVEGLGAVRKVQEEIRDYEIGEGPMHVIFETAQDVGEPHYRSRFFKLEGYYTSYDGPDWDGAIAEVHPKVKTFLIFE